MAFSYPNSNKTWSPISYAFSKSSDEMADIFINFYKPLKNPEAYGDVSRRKYSNRVEVIMVNLMHVVISNMGL